MLKLIILHLLVLILIPIVWYMMKHESWRLPGPAGTESLGSPLSESEQNYYDTVFSYTMENVPDGKPYHWQVGRSSGDIEGGVPFVSRSHAYCRTYVESFIVNGMKGTAKGYACRRTEDEDSTSWCRLREGQILTCAMEHHGLLD